MENFLSTFVFILPGIMTYFWLQAFGLNSPVKHTAPEVSGIAALLWIPITLLTLTVLNIYSKAGPINSVFTVDSTWTVTDFVNATADLKYLSLFLGISAVVSYLFSWFWASKGNLFLQGMVNFVRRKRKIAPLSQSATVWEEFFIKINRSDIDEEENFEEAINEKKALLLVYKIDKKEEFVVGSMTKASRPYEVDKALVLDDTEIWFEALNHYDYPVIRTYVDVKSGVIVKELDSDKGVLKTIVEEQSPSDEI
ncbi:hypothetical protein B14911_10897 [Bacillus sp. NRRL B-14911]|uniref:hypothetical protein n=1 Tax=Bacillus sp. NRRL B-14911 TaxID=313627 RepID=UPI00006B594D|nr:hypothetical protein [Bacillus sp. NRRL B-14911]EAR66237.1 hypothetical protein B14911_10897 [Bacillus sp. NRRL B-14911]